ncbi:MAG TPA: NADH-quinone oxidoreductase subunit J, partial [Pirellulaceae bacterium]|nr:NADH-quinone oxidoreductase subunit J [Pirellulaceae bacterium]
MTGMIAAIEWGKLMKLPLTWALIAGALALLLLIPDTGRRRRRLGIVVAAVAAACLLASFARLGALGPTLTFGSLAALTLGSACATISSRSAVYSAIWFAVSLLGTGGLLMLQDAQFLGIATIVVYAGAIVVTLLFVVMLAQPEGHDTYDRLSWGSLAKPAAVVTATIMLGLVLSAIGKTRDLPASSGKSPLVASAADAAKADTAKTASVKSAASDTQAADKAAGGESSDDKTGSDKSSGDKPSSDKQSGEKPATTKRASDKGP